MKRSMMKRSMTGRLQLAFIVVFAIVCIGLLFLHPRNEAAGGTDARTRCEAKGDWWDDQDHICAVPTPLSTLTHRSASPP
jgi:uncharacterized membrane protein YjdF